MKRFKCALAGLAVSLVFVGANDPAQADPILSFGIIGVGSYSVNTINIMATTTTKLIPTSEEVGGTTTPITFSEAGLATGNPVVFSAYTLNTSNGVDDFTVTSGNLIFSFANVSSVVIAPTTSTKPGSISEQFNGSVTDDTSGFGFIGQTASISETCTQTGLGAAITCSESLATPGLPIDTPEPMSLALLGVGVIGLGLVRRARLI